jgi:GNAT superfamily N-acetyltransferase
VRVVPVEGGAALEAFKAVYLDGWDVWSGIAAMLASYMDRWPLIADWRLYLASVGGTPAAAGVLHVSDGVAYLADAATAKAFRRRGCQRVLLQARIDAALAAGCDYVVSRAEFDSVSHHNIERAGIPMVYARSVWTRKGLPS